jgi:DNA-binding transcriptional MerR regulator
MGTHQPIRKTVTPEIPDKLYFRIGDVARLCEVPAYVLRFWETEFPQLKPNKGGTGQRLYRKRDVEMALRIKSLLYDQGYTIPGARQVFKNEQKARENGPFEANSPALTAVPAPLPAPPEAAKPADAARAGQIEARLRALRAEMEELVTMLGGAPSEAPKAQAPKASAPKPRAMRPQLVLEPRTGGKPEIKLPAPRPQLTQRDLFAPDDEAAPDSAS